MLHYQVTQGFQDFEAWINRPDGAKLFMAKEGEHGPEQKIYFEAKTAGEYEFCIHNNGASNSEKLIMISMATLSKRRAQKKVDPIVKTLAKSEAALISLAEDQAYMRTREREHRETLESNNTRVIVRGVIEIIMMLAMSVGQVYFLRRLFFFFFLNGEH